jgi:hypothetical protein
MRSITGRVGLAAAAALAVCLGWAVPAGAVPPGPNVNFPGLIGRVVACSTLLPIEGALVTVTPVTATTQAVPDPTAVESNPGGHYMVRGLAAGQYFVSVAAAGYYNPGSSGITASAVTITIPPGPNVSPNPAPVFLDFGLTPIGFPPNPCVPPGPNI